jgi:hypothetical protein
MAEPTRAEHLAWCKQRALAYVDSGDLMEAFVSMISDLGKHPETRSHEGILEGSTLMDRGNLGNAQAMRRFISSIK